MGTCVDVRGRPVVAPDPYRTVAIPWKPRLDSAWDQSFFIGLFPVNYVSHVRVQADPRGINLFL